MKNKLSFKLIKLKIFFFTLFLVLILISCADNEDYKSIDLLKVVPESQTVENKTMLKQQIYYFGFDRKLSSVEDIKTLSPLISYLNNKTNYKFELHFDEKSQDIVDKLAGGTVFFAYFEPLTYLKAKKNSNIKCLVKFAGIDGNSYKSVIFVKNNSSIDSIDRLKGKKFAFGPKNLIQGYLIPRKMLEDNKIALADLKSLTNTDSHKSTVKEVLKNRYDAGAIQDILGYRLEAEGLIKIIGRSKNYPAGVICCNKNIPEEVINKVQKAMLSIKPLKNHPPFPEWGNTEMSGGFKDIEKEEYNEIEILAKRYGLVK